MIKPLVLCLLRWLYRFRGFNTTVLDTPGPVLLLPNHISWWDWLFIGVWLENDWRFVTSSTSAEISWLHKKIMVNRRTFPVDMNSPFAVKHMAEYLQKGGRLVLFPEGRISTTGSLMKLFEGTGFLLLKTKAKVITAYIRGAHRLPYSRNSDKKKLFPKVSVHFSALLTPPTRGTSTLAEARLRLTEWTRARMIRLQFEAEMAEGPETLPEAILLAARTVPRLRILQDASLKETSYRELQIGAELLGERWGAQLKSQSRHVGVLLPNVTAFPVVLLSLWLAEKVPAILNYTMGPALLAACARLAGLNQIISSRAFVERSGLDLTALRSTGAEILFLEDIRAKIGKGSRILAFGRALLGLQPKSPTKPADTALILFTSGSEGDPKGVELTHRNLLANIRQMLAVIDLKDSDRVFNALPLFHSFGLSIGLLLPLVQRIFTFLYLSPLHYRVVPAAFYNLNCTVLFGTNTFLGGYARKAHPYDFRSLRYLFAGAEKIQEATSALWMRKFGIRILEGYGATECSPCLTLNVPMETRLGTAGQFLPGIEYRLEPVEGVTTGSETPPPVPGKSNPSPPSLPGTEPIGRLFVRGPNVMRGYLNPEANSQFQALGGWYDTGDIALVDREGFVHILGRLKRFAKVSGEMVSLAAVEEALAGELTGYGSKFAIAVVAKPDQSKGEKLIAVTNEKQLTLEDVRTAIRSRGLSNLAVPRELKVLRELPRLGSGKTNHRELIKLISD